MNITVATVFPALYQEFLNTSLIKRSQEKEIASFDVVSFSSFCAPKERIDAPAAGHGSGMVIRPEVMERLVDGQDAKWGTSYKIFLTPQGKKLDQRTAVELAALFQKNSHIMLVAGRYEGIDERAHKEYADLEISIGDYVLMGGDVAVMVLLEAVMRHLPGIVGKGDSVELDSFSGAFVDFPTYTTPPREWKGRSIPPVLLEGNHAAMNSFRNEVAAKRSVLEHFQWVRAHCTEKNDRKLVQKNIPAHYVVLMHDQVIVQEGTVGTSSVTSLDIHDIARSSCTYGIKNYFLVTPLIDQQKIAETIIKFWHGAGIAYNHNRAEAVDLVKLTTSLDETIAAIEAIEGKKPLLIATSAKVYASFPIIPSDAQRASGTQSAVIGCEVNLPQESSSTKCEDPVLITYRDQKLVWAEDRPVLFIFGTAKGLCDELIQRCDYLLPPLQGFTDFNHLSVRSAAAIILDRWLGVDLS